MSADKLSSTEPFETSGPFPPNDASEQFPLELSAPLTDEEIEVGLDMEWAYNDPETQERYPDKIVAVYHRKVVAVGEDWGKVRQEAERITGVPRNRIAVVSILGFDFLSS